MQIDLLSPLQTQRLQLRPLQPTDAEPLHRLINDWAVVRMLETLPFPYPRELADDWIVSTHDRLANGTGCYLAIVLRENEQDVLIGTVSLNPHRETHEARLGYWIGRRYWGQGFASEAAGRMARWGLANLDITRVTAHCAADNLASAAVLRRIGFRDAGTGQGRFRARGGEHPVLLFEAMRDDLFGAVEAEPPAMPHEPISAGLPVGTPLLLVAACALIDIDGRVLLARRPEGKKMAGLWEFPGGKLDPGETPEAALIRELREELGIDVAQSCLAPLAFASHAYDRVHLLMPLYVCRRWTGVPQGREGQTLAWVRPDKLADYKMPPADMPLLPLLRDIL
jgi:8-oxo-dGTP diphosphatase